MIIFLKVMVGISLLIFLIGLIKPKWVLFWMKEPDRLSATTLGLVLFMAAWTGIAKLTMKPRPHGQERETTQERSVDDQNQLQLSH